MVHLFKHLSFICPFTCLSGYNSDTITELERKCRRLQTQVFQMEVQWNTVLLPPPPLPAPGFILPPRYYDHIISKTLKLKMTTVEVVNQPARKMFSRGLLRPG